MPVSLASLWRISVFLILGMGVYAGNLLQLMPSSLPPDLIGASLLLDLCLWVPLLYHFLLARPGIGPVFLGRLLLTAGLATSLYLMPQDSLLFSLKSLLPKLMLLVAALLLCRSLWRMARCWPALKPLPAEERIAALAQVAVPGKLAKLIEGEWLGIYYGLFGWRLVTKPDERRSFSYHQKSGAVGMLIGLSLFQLPGLVFTHIIFLHISPTLALVLTVGHIYTLYFGLSQAMAMKHRPMLLSAEGLRLRSGLLFDQLIPWDAIASIDTASLISLSERKPGRLNIGLFGHANLLISFRQKQRISLLAGLGKEVNELVLGLDNPHAFRSACLAHMTPAGPTPQV